MKILAVCVACYDFESYQQQEQQHAPYLPLFLMQ